MYLEYFNLSEAPFSITPDPAFVYLSQRHRDALAHLLYGVGQGGSGGFVQLTGEVGTGKTTLCRCLLEQVPERTRIALVLNPLMSPRELLVAICEELGIETQGMEDSSKALVDRLNETLLRAHAAGERVVVVIDEAQNLSPESLEQVRLLTNLETNKQKLLQIVLLGQPELRALLQRQSLRQLAQRITARYHLTPLGQADTTQYVRHRMQVAGARHNPFRKSALRALFQRSNGVPRLINIIADRALVAAYAQERRDIDGRLVHAAADEVQLGEPGARRSRWPWVAAAVAGLLLAVLAWTWIRPWTKPALMPPVQAEPQLAAESAPPPALAEEPAPVLPAGPPVTLDERWLRDQDQAAWEGLAAAWDEPLAAAAIRGACETG
ncbi:MAG TPA: AAA family ATPase, partial [Xanthomonadales bacterium]|nr:AAA family ATPase [Xanthomonadales bacterium]